MKRLKIIYVDHLPSTPPEESSPEIVHVFIGTSRKKVELSILRNGFIVTDPALHEIERRIEQLEHAAPRRVRSVAESVGLYPNVSAEWRRFFDDLLQRENSWAFLVPVVQANSQN